MTTTPKRGYRCAKCKNFIEKDVDTALAHLKACGVVYMSMYPPSHPQDPLWGRYFEYRQLPL